MSYGYRINVESIFLKHADECWQRANKNMDDIEDENPKTMERSTFKGPKTEQCISDCIFALTGWAICLESYVNLAWNTCDKTKDKTEDLKIKNTSDKLKIILKENNIDRSDKNWLANIKELFIKRNDFVHFKEVVKYAGFTFAPTYQKDLSLKNLQNYRNALEEAINLLSTTVGLEAKFLDGNFELFYYDE